MVLFNRKRHSRRLAGGLEPLEDRRLLSAAHAAPSHGGKPTARGGASAIGSAAHSGLNQLGLNQGATILFSQAPKAVQIGLAALATTDGLTTPTDAQTVYLGNSNGVETYTVDLTGGSSDTKITVDQNGKQVLAPTSNTTTFGAIAISAVTDEITAIATALNLTAPASTTSVKVTTPASGVAVYTLQLSGSSTGRRSRGTSISVDANGDPVGNESVPLSTLSTAIQTGLTNNAPAGATALTSTSLVTVRTLNGVTTYSATYNSTGIRTTVTVDAKGNLANLPSTTTVQFTTLTATVQAALQALATADGVTTTISDTQSVSVYDEANGTIIYTVRLSTSTTSSTTFSVPIVLSVDQDGNPTVPPHDGGFDGGFGGGFGGGFC